MNMSEQKEAAPVTSGKAAVSGQALSSLVWKGNRLSMLDQRLLPETIVMLDLFTAEEVWDGIHAMKIRGAPAIGMAAPTALC